MKKPKIQNSKFKNMEIPTARQGNRIFNFERERPAFTLLETIIALAVIVSAMAGPFTLATRGIFSAKFARNKLIALNLAQEGIEIIRNARENNVLGGFAWRGLNPDCPAPPTRCVRLSNAAYQVEIFTDDPPENQPHISLSTNSPLKIENDPSSAYYGVYSQSGGTQTQFTRVVTISTPGDDQMKVVSTVTWLEAGTSRKVELQEVMYNWL